MLGALVQRTFASLHNTFAGWTYFSSLADPWASRDSRGATCGMLHELGAIETQTTRANIGHRIQITPRRTVSSGEQSPTTGIGPYRIRVLASSPQSQDLLFLRMIAKINQSSKGIAQSSKGLLRQSY